MKEAFRGFIRREIPEPHESTRLLLDYVSMCDASFRGESAGGASELNWYFQFSFKGCAGEAEVAAQLGWHWMHLWMQREYDSIARDFLNPEGFSPTESRSVQDGSMITFLPLKDYGHAACRFDDIPEGEAPNFELEAFIYECGGESEDGLNRLMQQHFGALMADRHCRCQLCMPSFAPVKIELDLEIDMEV